MIAFFKKMLHSRRWEDRFGSINGILAIITSRKEGEDLAELDSFQWDYILSKSFPELLVDEEFRVRN